MAMGLDAEAVCGCFRPLSRGSFFNKRTISCLCEWQFVFVPFLGDLFFNNNHGASDVLGKPVFVPFLGNLFSIMDGICPFIYGGRGFSSPFSGTFFQCPQKCRVMFIGNLCFRPLSWGLSFNDLYYCGCCDAQYKFSSPFLGTFFQFDGAILYTAKVGIFSSPFLGTFFQWMRA